MDEMGLSFSGSAEELERRFSTLEGKWDNEDKGILRFRKIGGGVVSWYPPTGKIVCQGKVKILDELIKQVAAALSDEQRVQKAEGEAIATAKSKPQRAATSKVPNPEPNGQTYKLDHDSELVIGLVGAVGTDLEHVTKILSDRLAKFEYTTKSIRISNDIITPVAEIEQTKDNYQRIDRLMTAGNKLRKDASDKALLVKAAAAKISQIRVDINKKEEPLKKHAFIISSLKHPDEVQALRKIYSNGFFLIGVFAAESRRVEYLIKNKDISPENAELLINRDVDESNPFGQHTRNTYHLSDFFINYDGNIDRLQHDLWRTLDLMFGSPFVTPTFDEFSMFMAFSASLRSADLSRQVGAVVTKNKSIVGTGANDVPKYGGGQYWPESNGKEILDQKGGRDYTLGKDPNVAERQAIIDDILRGIPADQHGIVRDALNQSKLRNLTEYGRVVHAEMDALLSCARESIGTQNAELYCTTFPCHNCAKHIISAGIKRVVYVEPYPKSKALDFHGDAITLSTEGPQNKVVFEPFVGVGPRSFFNLFSTNLGSGYPIRRKEDDGSTAEWDPHNSRLRMQMLPTSYIERETAAAAELKEILEKIK